jgi:endogenous inhibitor of DNA gyrase (YacG/DUF329 family)
MSNESNPNSRSPECPKCGASLERARVNLVRPFVCPTCGTTLAISESYRKYFRGTIYALTLLSCAALGLRNVFLLLLAPVVLFLISVVAGIVGARIFIPPLDDVVAKSKEARYLFR